MKKRKRTIPMWPIVTEVILVALFTFLTVWWFGFSYPDFERVTTRGALIPGLGSGLSPQGICSLPESAEKSGFSYAVSGYVDGKPSRVYLLYSDPVIGEVKHTEFYVTFTENGKDIKTHFGGVACTNDFLYIASGDRIVRVSLGKILSAQNGARVEIDDGFRTGLQNAYCYIYGGELYAGEFYRPGNYETPASHHITMEGITNRALVYVFPMNEQNEGGVADMVPSKVLSVCDQVQGIAVGDGHILLSTSYGLADSSLKIYEEIRGDADGSFSVNGKEIPLYFLGKDCRTFRMPCMSEELFIKDGEVTVLFESMSLKYRFVVHTRISRLIGFRLGDVLGEENK